MSFENPPDFPSMKVLCLTDTRIILLTQIRSMRTSPHPSLTKPLLA